MATKLQLRTRATDMADATGSTRWSTTATTGEVDVRLGVVHWRLWKRILNAHPYFRMAKRTPAADPEGRYLISALSTDSEIFYRVLKFAVEERPYKFAVAKDYLLRAASDSDSRQYVWWREGDYLMALPKAAEGTTPTGIWVSHVPMRFDLIETDGATVVWPDGYEDILVAYGAAALLRKGATEARAAAELERWGEEMLGELLQDIARPSLNPLEFQYTDSASEWGG